MLLLIRVSSVHWCGEWHHQRPQSQTIQRLLFHVRVRVHKSGDWKKMIGISSPDLQGDFLLQKRNLKFWNLICDNHERYRRTTAVNTLPKTTRFNWYMQYIQLLMIERPVREKAVESLRLFLSQSRQFTELDFLKLWKGLYYCMWMSDRMRVQQQLADTLGDLVSVLHTKNTILFVQAFWTILCKQWPTLDQHRYVACRPDSHQTGQVLFTCSTIRGCFIQVSAEERMVWGTSTKLHRYVISWTVTVRSWTS